MKKEKVQEPETVEAEKNDQGPSRTLEDEEITLEDSFQAYKKGMDLLKICNDKIDKVEKKVLMLNEEGGLDEF